MKYFLIIFSLVFYHSISAQIITDRPTQSESSSTVSRGTFQLESGASLNYTGTGDEAIQQVLIPTNLFRLGISKGIELRLINQWENLKVTGKSYQGMSDLIVGAKIQLYQPKSSNTEIAFVHHSVVPSGSDGLSSGMYGMINKISLGHQLTNNLGLGYNLGYGYFGSGNGDIIYSVYLANQINDKVTVFIEPYGEITNMEDFSLNYDAGITYLIATNLQLDLSFGSGITEKMNYLSFGISWMAQRNVN